MGRNQLEVIAADGIDTLCIEPWATELHLRAGQVYQIVAFASDDPRFETEVSNSTCTVSIHGLEATFEIRTKGELLFHMPVATPILGGAKGA